MVEAPFTGNRAPGSNPIVLYLAARILRAAGLSAEGIARALREVYGVDVELDEVERWLDTIPPEVMEKPTLLYFIRTLSKDKLQALRYLAGAMLGDGDRYGQLRVTDVSFAQAYANALAIVTGDQAAAAVKKGKDGYHTRCCWLARYIRDGLWKILAFLDRLDEKKHFLSGLLDAEGSISPHVGREKLERFQITFVNTEPELAELVKTLLEDLGLNPRLRIITQTRCSVINGKLAMRKKPLYVVHVDTDLYVVRALTRLNLQCERKRKMLEFLVSTSQLDSRSRYEELTRHWRRWRGKWWPVDMLPQDAMPEPDKRSEKHVRCPACKRPGVFARQRNGNTTIIYVIHEDGKCELISAENGKCPKCGYPGRLEAVTDTDARRRRCYKYLKLRVEHRDGTRRYCHLMRIPLEEPPPHAATS